MHPFSALGARYQQTDPASEPREENKQANSLFHPPETYLSEGGEEGAYRQGVLGMFAGVDLDESATTEDEEAQVEL